MRDDFLLPTKVQLAERVSHRCSFPGCDQTTVGPSEESLTAVSRTGMACHISAAAPGKGARRYDSQMSSEKRSSIENGIWLCYTHGKMVDTDEVRFTVEMLERWREIAVLRAKWHQEHGLDTPLPSGYLTSRFKLAGELIEFTMIGGENEIIGQALHDCCVDELWSVDVSHAIRDMTVELARNAFMHGSATQCSLQIFNDRVEFISNGDDFDIYGLLDHPNARGGSFSLSSIYNNYYDLVILTQTRVGNLNKITFGRNINRASFSIAKPCLLDIGYYYRKEGGRLEIIEMLESEDLVECRSVYLALPEYVSPSDIYSLNRILVDEVAGRREKLDGKQLVFVVCLVSPPVRDLIAKLFPNCRVIETTRSDPKRSPWETEEL